MVKQATKMVKKHHEESILKYSNKTVKQLFEEHGIDDENNWTGKIIFLYLYNDNILAVY